jgi:hypothetical protein
VGAQIAGRQEGLDPQVIARAWATQLRLCGRFRRLAAPKTSKNVVVAAIARELAGCLWAEMTAGTRCMPTHLLGIGQGGELIVTTRRGATVAGPIPSVLCAPAWPAAFLVRAPSCG